MAESDLKLVERIKQGDQGAFAMIVEKYENTVFNVAYRIVGDGDDAADITQTTFIKVFRNIDSFNPAYKFFSWLYRITMNEALNFRRKQQRNSSLATDVPQTDHSPEDDYRQNELSEHLQRALLTMSMDHRLVIVLKHLLMLPYKEIGEILDLPEKTVKSRLFTARQVLRKQLLKQGYA